MPSYIVDDFQTSTRADHESEQVEQGGEVTPERQDFSVKQQVSYAGKEEQSAD